MSQLPSPLIEICEDGKPGLRVCLKGAGQSQQQRGGPGPCDRPFGTKPRNSQQQSLPYYFQRDHACLTFGMNATQILLPNPYRRVLVITGQFDTGSVGVSFAAKRDDLDPFVLGFHPVFSIAPSPTPTTAPCQTNSIVLNYEDHGALVTDGWAGVGTAPLDGASLTGYQYSD